MEINELLRQCAGFQWDKGNYTKNLEKHRVTAAECEEPFFNQPLLVLPDEKHSQDEERWIALGRTNAVRLLLLAFCVRASVHGPLIRVISARDMTPREKKEYLTA